MEQVLPSSTPEQVPDLSDGSMKSKVNYYYGNKHGKEELFYDNGQLQSLTEYNEGEVIFETIRWTKAGDLIP